MPSLFGRYKVETVATLKTKNTDLEKTFADSTLRFGTLETIRIRCEILDANRRDVKP
jgi:hypothetical protein